MGGGNGGAGERERKRGNPITLEDAQRAILRALTLGEEPERAMLGLCVDYRPRDARRLKPEPGVIVAVNDRFVMVRYWGERNAKATIPDCLEWAYPEFRS